MKKNKTMCCSDCLGDKIFWRVWVDETNKIIRSCEEKHCYCDHCEKETRPMFKMDHNLKGIK